ncbi:MAG: competence/damage-inducible protein A [Lautropia sp.]|nr:competence/damage-inducible protein A [Lautropia sp.]MCL4702973.1 competence/damage-inducible protein A [Burkholderiaceae bacterium]MDL1907687.1 competence/damage-inducible protein A [Betaproteobacteria bacterium PRO1]MEB2335744.1 molybdopterin-binding protein [Burkholderiales bacterium]RIK85877.1 MAG: competence/damage-inducible protein A [Burkholderiales bacterium]
MNFGLIVVGDEILSGKRQDRHFARVVEMLGGRGLRLSWARFLGDDREQLATELTRSFASGDAVFCCGGIGATPDDHTRQAAAAALGVGLALHPEAARLIAERTAEMAREGRGSADMSLPENRQRLRMGEFPVGAEIVPNPFNRIPGFAIRNHFFVPGFPVMAWPMIEAVLDSRFAHLFHREQRAERSFLVYGLAESTATPLMEQVERSFPGVRVFSLPSMGEDGVRRHIELGVRGPVSMVDEACARLEAGARELGGELR